MAWLMRLLALLSVVFAAASSSVAAAPVSIGFIAEPVLAQPVGPVDDVATDEGLAGARLGLADDQTTGKFTGQAFDLIESIVAPGNDVASAVRALARQGAHLIIADLDHDALLVAADAAKASGAVVFNSRAEDDDLRNETCRANLFHTVPSRAMLADGLAQYLVWKRWSRWFLVVGATPADEQLAAALHRAADRFGGTIVAEKKWTFRLGNGRSDTGHVLLQTEIPSFTAGVDDYDVLVVADEEDVFGAYLEGRTALPRPIAGTHGLIATGWSAVTDQWGATQLQARFRKLAGRWMTPRDYAAWLAMRSIGEAVIRGGSAGDAGSTGAFLHSPDFLVAGFKGQGLTFRPWDNQLRQPILVAGPRLLVSVSPQEGYLHPDTALDTLGTAREETKCRF
jgi:ABC transporter substrate binding protein (PQQ-dependent alcohol dehydrogenase system)